MAAKRTLKYKYNRLPPLLDLVNDLIDRCLRHIESPEFKATVSGLVQLIRLRLKIDPPEPAPRKVVWVDRDEPIPVPT
jgi:hypothetical protein